jgi:hypothetical protein
LFTVLSLFGMGWRLKPRLRAYGHQVRLRGLPPAGG